MYKLLLLLGMIAITLIAGLVPIKIVRQLRNHPSHDGRQARLVSLLSCFSGGVFLSSCFLHLLPEANTNYRALFGESIDYPIVELLSSVGFFLIYIGEEVLIACSPGLGHSHATTKQIDVGAGNSGSSLTHEYQTIHAPNCKLREGTSIIEPPTNDAAANRTIMYEGCCRAEKLPLLVIAEPERCHMRADDDPAAQPLSAPHQHSHGARSITFVLALSLHSVIEGVAFGVMGSMQSATMLFITVIIHKAIVAFSVGVQLARTHGHQLRWVFAAILLLACMTPLGALIGIVLQESSLLESRTQETVVMVAESVAVGTFLYVTFFEVLINERNNASGSSIVKMMCIMIGYASIALLRLFDTHSHEGDSYSNRTTHHDH